MPHTNNMPPDMIEAIKSRKAEAYAWPGGYPIIYLMDDADILCADCVNDPTNPVHIGMTGDADGWRIDGFDVFYEGAPIHCAHCNKVIESAYGDPEGNDYDAR